MKLIITITLIQKTLYNNMYKKVILFIGLFVIISCDKAGIGSLSENDYKNASLYMGSGFNKYLNNILTFQKWESEQYFYYKVKHENKRKASELI